MFQKAVLFSARSTIIFNWPSNIKLHCSKQHSRQVQEFRRQFR